MTLTRRYPLARIVAISIILLSLMWTGKASAYAWMVRHDYTACAQCHADPSGGGVLTAYGRAQGVLLLTSKWGANEEDEEPGRVKDFAFGIFPLPDSVLLGGDYRILYLNQWVGVPNAGSTHVERLIQMQADLQGQVSAGRLRANASVGYDHNGGQAAAVTARDTDNMVSRVHWLGADLGADRQFLLRVGRMNLPYGVRSIEHETFVHRATRTDINVSQQDGIALAWNQEHFRAEIMGIAGNFQVNPDRFRDRGYAAYFEWAPRNDLAIGVSSEVAHVVSDRLFSGFPEAWRQSHGLFARYSPLRAVVIAAEADALLDSTPDSSVRGGFWAKPRCSRWTSNLGKASISSRPARHYISPPTEEVLRLAGGHLSHGSSCRTSTCALTR